MACLVGDVAALVAAVMEYPHTPVFLYGIAAGITIWAAHNEIQITYSRTIDAPASEPPIDIIFEDGHQDMNSILADAKLPALLPPAPAVLFPLSGDVQSLTMK